VTGELDRPPAFRPPPHGVLPAAPDGQEAAVPGILTAPEWVIAGGRLTGSPYRYRLIASRDLRAAGLTYDGIGHDIDWAAWAQPGGGATVVMNTSIRLTCWLRSGFMLVDGNSYGECLAALFRNWAPDGTGPLALTAGGAR
jgi:hypothetical protein